MKCRTGVLAVPIALLSQVACAQAPPAFTLEQVLSAPYATTPTAAPAGGLFAWVEHTEGRNNLFTGGANRPTRQLTSNAEDDAQDISQLAWAPDASAIAYTYGAETGAAGQPANPAHLQRPTPLEVWIAPLASGTSPVRVGEGHSPLFEPLNHHLYFIRSGQIWSADLRIVCTSATGCELQVPSASVRQLVFDRGKAGSLTLSPDGRLLAFISRREEDGQPSHSFLAIFDLRTGTLRLPSPSTGNDSAPVFSPNGHQIAWLRSPFTQPPEFAPNRISPNPWSIQVLDLLSGEAGTIFTPEANQRGSVLPHLADSEPRIYFPANDSIGFFSEADGWVHLYEIHAPGTPEIHEVQWMTTGPAETEDPVYGKDHRYLLYSSNQPSADPLDHNQDTDRRHLWHLDLTQPDILSVQLTHGVGIETHPVIAADGTLAALVSDARTPMHPALIGKDGSITPLHPVLPAGYPGAALITPERVLIPSAAQPAALHSQQEDLPLNLHGQLFLPPGATSRKRPAIVFLHGGPNRQMLLGYPAMDYYSNAYAMNQYLASRGFLVLSVNYRCGIGYGLEFRQCLHAGPDGAEEYDDVLAAAKYLRARADVDATRIGIWGGSYGGYLTALALARNSNLFAAGVDFHGVHDWNLEDNASAWRQGNNAKRDALAARALASSPLADVSRWTSPVLLIHGDDDPDVAYAQTPTLADALRARKVPVQELIFPDELHGLLLHKDWLAAYTAAAAFFERTLRP